MGGCCKLVQPGVQNTRIYSEGSEPSELIPVALGLCGDGAVKTTPIVAVNRKGTFKNRVGEEGMGEVEVEEETCVLVFCSTVGGR